MRARPDWDRALEDGSGPRVVAVVPDGRRNGSEADGADHAKGTNGVMFTFTTA
jgi:hypothetical protein